MSRREVLFLGGGVLAGTILAACGGSSSHPSSSTPTTASYRSRPDLKPPLIDVKRGLGMPGSGYVCIAPSGPLLVDDAGEPVWIHPVPKAAANFEVQTLGGRPVLTWWQGEIAKYGVGLSGEFVIMDSNYHDVMTVQAQHGLPADLHEFLITPEGIAYFLAYRQYTTDLRSVGGPSSGQALDPMIQAVDLSTGSLVFEWSSADHIDFAESEATYSADVPFDPVHSNSINITPDGKILLSARNTWTIYKIDPATGEIIWRLGGKKSDFELGRGVHFAWQHDARMYPDGTMSLFDNQAEPAQAKQSRGLVLNVDEVDKATSVRSQYFHPRMSLLAESQGSFQILPNDNVVVGWGAEPYYTEFTSGGTTVLDAKMEKGTSYRAFRFEWSGRPSNVPAVASTSESGRAMVYASWNGSTETTSWRLLAGFSADQLVSVTEVRRDGFETAIEAPHRATHAAVAALNTSGTVLAQSPTIKL
jgi:hypothetical protein